MVASTARLSLGLLLALLGCSEGRDAALSQGGASFASSPAHRAAWPRELKTLTFGVAPYAEHQVILDTYNPLITHLSGQLGIPVSLVVAKDYADLVDRMLTRRVDLAQLPPASYVRLRARDPEARLIASQITEGAGSYVGYLVVRADDPAGRLEDLAGRSFCYVDPESTTGYLLPLAMVRALGHDPERFFRSTHWGGNHTACLRRVVSGTADAAVISSSAIATARRSAFPLGRVRVIGKTPRVPWDAYCARSGLPPAAAERLRWELLSLSTQTPSGRDILDGPIRMNAWREVRDEDYDIVRQALTGATSW